MNDTLVETLIAIITILGTALLAFCAYSFNWLRGEFREFKAEIWKTLDGFRQDINKTNDNLTGIVRNFDERLANVEKNKRKK